MTGVVAFERALLLTHEERRSVMLMLTHNTLSCHWYSVPILLVHDHTGGITRWVLDDPYMYIAC